MREGTKVYPGLKGCSTGVKQAFVSSKNLIIALHLSSCQKSRKERSGATGEKCHGVAWARAMDMIG